MGNRDITVIGPKTTLPKAFRRRRVALYARVSTDRTEQENSLGYPHDEAWKIALSACKDFINENPGYDISIVFVSTNRDMVEQGKQILAKLNEVKILLYLNTTVNPS